MEYDVFLSFRGDVRFSFADHLYYALKGKLKTFRDENDIGKGKIIATEIKKAIEGSRSAVIVLSENYAGSVWCLDEVVMILDCMKNQGQIVFPVFYKVDPSDVEELTGKFGEAFAEIEEKCGKSDEKVERWRIALKNVVDLAGFVLLDGHEYKFIQDTIKVIEETLRGLNSTTPMDLPAPADDSVKGTPPAPPSQAQFHGNLGISGELKQMMTINTFSLVVLVTIGAQLLPQMVNRGKYFYMRYMYPVAFGSVGFRIGERPANQDEADRRIIEAHERDASQEDVAFVPGIAPQYIPSAQRPEREKGADVESYINAAFRSNINQDEAYIFMKNEYVLINYAPGTVNDKLIQGPILIRDGFPSLANTPFGEYGIDCAFGCHNRNEAFIFSGNLCARIDYSPGPKSGKILKGPMPIGAMFPFFKGTVFENGIDAAFESNVENWAYLFKGDQYVRIDYSTPRLIGNIIRKIGGGFWGLRGTIFESGFDAALASSKKDEAYLFKGDKYARINFAPGTNNDYIMGGVRPILPDYWPALNNILPRKNHGGFVDKSILNGSRPISYKS